MPEAASDPVADFQAIVKTRNDALRKLQALERPLLSRSTQLAAKRRNGTALSAEENEEFTTAEAGLDRIHHSMWIIGQISLQAMNDSPLLRDLTAGLNGVAKDLGKAEKKLKKIAKVADTTAQVTAVLVELAQKVGAAMV